MVAGMPSRAAWNATASPWLPALAALGGVELEQEVGGAALLERARHLEIFQLEVAVRAGQLGQGVGVRAGRPVDRVSQPVTGRLDGGEVGQLGHA